jgi:rubrerythrin
LVFLLCETSRYSGHAYGHIEFLKEAGENSTDRPIGNTKQNIISAIIGEKHDYTDMYPGFARIAREEGFDEIAEWFETLIKAEKSHTIKLTKALSSL